MSGIDVSTRGVSASAAADSGITTTDILTAADWGTEFIFKKVLLSHYFSYGCAVLSSRSDKT